MGRTNNRSSAEEADAVCALAPAGSVNAGVKPEHLGQYSITRTLTATQCGHHVTFALHSAHSSITQPQQHSSTATSSTAASNRGTKSSSNLNSTTSSALAPSVSPSWWWPLCAVLSWCAACSAGLHRLQLKVTVVLAALAGFLVQQLEASQAQAKIYKYQFRLSEVQHEVHRAQRQYQACRIRVREVERALRVRKVKALFARIVSPDYGDAREDQLGHHKAALARAARRLTLCLKVQVRLDRKLAKLRQQLHSCQKEVSE